MDQDICYCIGDVTAWYLSFTRFRPTDAYFVEHKMQILGGIEKWLSYKQYVQPAAENFEASPWHVFYVSGSFLQVNATGLAQHLFPWANLQEGGTSEAEAMAFLKMLLLGRKDQLTTLCSVMLYCSGGSTSLYAAIELHGSEQFPCVIAWWSFCTTNSMCKVQWVILTCTNLRTGGDLCKWKQLLMFMFAARGGTVLILACDPNNFPMKIMVDLSSPELNQQGHALIQWKIPWFQALLEECSPMIYCLKIEVRSSVVRTISLLHLPWDPGGLTRRRPGIKPNFMGIVQWVRGWWIFVALICCCGHYFDGALYLDQVCADQDYHLHVLVDQVPIGHDDDYIVTRLSQWPTIGRQGDLCLILVPDVLMLQDLQLAWDLDEKVLDWVQFAMQVRWDPSGSIWNRLEGKPKLMEGGLSATLLWAGPIHLDLAQKMDGLQLQKAHGCPRKRRLGTEGFGLAWLG